MAGASRSEAVEAAYRGLGATERLAALGALACVASLFLPWYRAPLRDDLVKTGWGAFGFSEAALLLTLAGALALLFAVGRGRRPPLPLHEGTLLAAAGVWSSLIIGSLMLDRPHFTLTGFEDDYGLAYGIFVALAGAAALTLAGLRIRRAEAAADRTPSAASPPRSAR